MKYIYIASLYRFGYELTVAETSEQKAKAAVIDDAKEDIEIYRMTIGKVDWR